LSLAENYYDWGEATGVIGALTFSVGTANYLASTGLFQDFLYSDSQGYLCPGQTQQLAVTVDAIVVTPETNTAFTMLIGVIIALYLQQRRFGHLSGHQYEFAALRRTEQSFGLDERVQ